MCPVGSFRLGASRLDDRPPFGDLGFLVGAERLRGLPLARRNDKALVDKFLAHGRIVRCANGGGVELVDDVPRRAFGGEQPRPQRELEPGEPRFLRRRDASVPLTRVTRTAEGVVIEAGGTSILVVMRSWPMPLTRRGGGGQ